jgi:hypothetical protein
MFRPGSLAAVALVAAACHPETPPAVRPEPIGGLARCRIAGVVELGAGDVLYKEARAPTEVARFAGGRVGVTTDAIEAGARASVVARLPAEGPGLALPGYVDVSRLPLHASRDLPVAGRSIYIAKGAPVSIRSASGGALRVTARYSDFPDVAADARCDDVALGASKEQPPKKTAERGEFHHLARDHARLFERPHGEVLADIRASRPGPTFEVDGFKRGLKHVRYEHGIVIDAWMNAEDLEDGPGPDCDHCYGADVLDVDDRCGAREHEDPGCGTPPPPTTRASRDAQVFATPRGPAIGVLDSGAEVFVGKKSDGFVRVSPTGGFFHSPAGTGFWVEESALAP